MEYSDIKGYLEYWISKEIQNSAKNATVEIVKDANNTPNGQRIHALYIKLPIGSEIKATHLFNMTSWRLYTRSCTELDTRLFTTDKGLTVEIQFSCNMVHDLDTAE